MLNKLFVALFRKSTGRESAGFNGRLLDQMRDDTFLAMHQARLFR